MEQAVHGEAMTGNKRTMRIGDLLRDEISAIIRTSMRDPRVEMLGVTAVEVSRDLQHAKVYLSSPRPDAEMDAIVRVVQRAQGFIRAELGRRRLDLRHLPELEFIADLSIERGNRIAGLLRALETSADATAVEGSEESNDTGKT